MSEQFSSEQGLFEEETQSKPTTKTNLKAFRLSTSSSGSGTEETASRLSPPNKRNSGIRFPINMAPPKGKAIEDQSGTVLGLSGLQKKTPGNALDFTRQDSKGNVVDIDLWNTAMDNVSATSLSRILNVAKVDNTYSLDQFIRDIEYQGFDRYFYIQHALSKMSISVFCRFALIGAIRGSNFTKICDTCEKMPQDLISSFGSLSFVKTPRKRTDLTILRNTASIPHWCAYYMLRANVAKKIPDDECPSHLQFPGAASIPMSRELRIKHINFCTKFSSLLPGGKFNVNIYLTAYNNMIPFEEIPQELISTLGVANQADAKALSVDDVTDHVGKAIVKSK